MKKRNILLGDMLRVFDGDFAGKHVEITGFMHKTRNGEYKSDCQKRPSTDFIAYENTCRKVYGRLNGITFYVIGVEMNSRETCIFPFRETTFEIIS